MYKKIFLSHYINGRIENMKKILLILCLGLLFFTGCNNTLNTPTKKVEEFLGKYQSMDSEVLAQLDNVISNDATMSDDQKKEYRLLMEKQYQNLSYKIKDENIIDDKATVDVEIEVFDYATSISKSLDYYNEHKDEFADDAKATIDEEDSDNDNDDGDNNDDAESEKDTNEVEDSKYIDYKIKQLKNVTDRIKYEITFNLTKEDDEWKIENISDIDRQKIHGLFEE